MEGTTPNSCEASSAPDSIEAHLVRHDRLLHFAVRRFVRARPDLETDILAVGRAALAAALDTYRTDSGFAFSTYAVRQMQWRVSGFLSQFTRRDFVTASLDEPRGKNDGEEFTLADVFDHQAAEREQSEAIADENLLRRIHDLRVAIATCATLTPSEREVLKAFLESGNGAAVAARLGLTPSRVSQGLGIATRKLRKHLRGSGC